MARGLTRLDLKLPWSILGKLSWEGRKSRGQVECGSGTFGSEKLAAFTTRSQGYCCSASPPQKKCSEKARWSGTLAPFRPPPA